MTRLLLDQGLAPSAAMILRQHGFDAVHVSELGMEKADDLQILERARIEERVWITSFICTWPSPGRGGLRWCCSACKGWTQQVKRR